MVKKKTRHYVDNQRFLEALKEYRDICQKASKAKQEKPPIPEYVGECILKIATHLSYKPEFVNYTFRDEMISDGVENCLVYLHNFDPNKTKNPFGYFTQVIYFAFIRRIQREKRHTYIKYKMIEQSQINGGAQNNTDGSYSPSSDGGLLAFDNVKDFINRFDEYMNNRRERRRKAKVKI